MKPPCENGSRSATKLPLIEMAQEVKDFRNDIISCLEMGASLQRISDAIRRCETLVVYIRSGAAVTLWNVLHESHGWLVCLRCINTETWKTALL